MQCFLLLASLMAVSLALPVCPGSGQGIAALKKASAWLERYGYLKNDVSWIDDSMLECELNNPIKKMQAYAGLKQTGILDDATAEQMAAPRCAHSDVEAIEGGRSKRYTKSGRYWSNDLVIDVQYGNYTADMTIEEQERIMQDVVDAWNAAADTKLVFHPINTYGGSSEIIVRHTEYDSRGSAFVPGGVIAYAYYPTTGDIYFDDVETWAEFHQNSPRLFSYKWTGLHEMGHSLGLSHSDVNSAVMFAYYQSSNTALTDDDIAGAVSIFGEPVAQTTAAPTNPTATQATTTRCRGRWCKKDKRRVARTIQL